MLSGQVGPNYYVKVEVRLYLHELSGEERRFFARPDVAVTTEREAAEAVPSAGVAAPMRLSLPAVDVERYSWIQIRDRRNRRVVTVLELLSPTNKTPGPDRDEYVTRRGLIFRDKIHFVEIDLGRGGRRPSPPELPPCDYYALVSRWEERTDLDMWPIRLRDRLPVIPIPLAAPDPDVRLDLQAVLDRAYDAADYGKYVYRETPEPPLSAEDAAWASQFLPPQA
jgi:hypothetical protein